MTRDGSSDESDCTDLGPELSAHLTAKLEVRVPGYRLDAQLAHGGQAFVFRASRLADGRSVVIKILRDGRLAAPAERARLRREVRALTLLSHPGIAEILDSGSTPDGLDFVVMAFIDGDRLDRALERAAAEDGRRLDLRLRLKLCSKISHAMAVAHTAGVTHRDLTPANILVDRSWEPHIIDFGLARTRFERFLEPAEVTQPGAFLGTLRYASPEQVGGTGEAVGPRSDVYSLGVILYEVLSGTAPYPISNHLPTAADTIANMQPAPLRLAPERPSGRAVAADTQLQAIVTKALCKAPEHRYGSANELAEDLDRYLDGIRVAARPQRHRPPPSRRQVLVAGALGTAALAAAAALGSSGPRRAAAATLTEPRLLHVLRGGPVPAGRLEIHPRNTLLRAAAIRPDVGVAVWRLDDGSRLAESDAGTLYDTYSPDGNVTYSPGKLFLSSVGLVVALDAADTEKARFSADSTRIATIREWVDPRVRVYRIDGVKLFERAFPYHRIAQFDLSPDGRHVAAAGGSPVSGLTLWDVDSGNEVAPVAWRGDAKTFVAFGLDGRELAAFDTIHGIVGRFDAASANRIDRSTIDAGPTTRRSRLHAVDGGFVVSWHCADVDRIVLWDVVAASARAALDLAAPATTICDVSRDGQRMLAADETGAVTLWDAGSGRRIELPPRPRSRVRWVTFSPDESLAASASEDGTVRVWRLPA